MLGLWKSRQFLNNYATYIKISHEEFSSTEFTFPFDMQPKCGYELSLVNKAEAINNGWASLTITTSPENGAEITLSGYFLLVVFVYYLFHNLYGFSDKYAL